MGQLLLYTEDKEIKQAVTKLCEDQGAVLRELVRADLNRTIIEIISGGAMSPKSGGAGTPVSALYVQPELMVFNGFTDSELDRFLEEYKARKLRKIDLKAVVTPYNCTWSILELTAELTKEHEEWK